MSAVTNLGKVSVTPKGTWANNTAYDILDIVAYQGSSYIAIQNVPSSGVPLSNTSYWLMIASKGDGGEITSVSASISGGYGTPGVTVTEGGTDHEKTLAFAFTNLVGLGISSITQTTTSSVSGGTNVITCTLTDGNSTTFAILNGTDGDAINIAPAYDSTATYNLGDLVVYNDTLYECTTAIPVAEAWDSTHWTATDVSGQLSKKANIDGSYDLMNTGTSDNWTPYSADSGATQDIPFINEATGGGNGESVVDTGSYLQLKRKLGNTVGVNQLRNTQSGSVSSSTAYANMSNEVIPDLVYGHYYYVGFDVKEASDNVDTTPYWFKLGNLGYGHYAVSIASSSAWVHYDHIAKLTLSGGTEGTNSSFQKGNNADKKSIEYKNLVIRDITRWFGSDGNIPSHLLSHPENWGRYYAGSLAYNAGTLESADGTVMRSIGRNLFDKATATLNAKLDRSGNAVSGFAGYAVSDWMECVPNTEYYFKDCCNLGDAVGVSFYDSSKNFVKYDGVYASTGDTTSGHKPSPANAHFMRISTRTSTLDICNVSLFYEGESGYDVVYPYSVLAEVDTGSEVLRSAGAVADEKTPDGTITRRVGVVDLGTLTWNYATDNQFNVFYAEAGNFPSIPAAPNAVISCHSPLYVALPNSSFSAFANGSTSHDKSCTIVSIGTKRLLVRDDSITSAAAFKTAMSGVYLYYELATPTTEQGTGFAENIPCDDFGSLMWTQTKGIPQGNEIFYPVDYKASFDTLYNIVDGDMSALATDDELQVVADRVPDAPSEDGTYTLKATISNGTKTYSWVADE